ncbi:NTP transferase domain-containing protein [Pedobacter steynii]|nr:NTP transferase domain-containing protein [Pedobacter steynii]
MGKDKGLIAFGSGNWAAHAVWKLEQLNIPVSISINPAQMQTYGHFFSAEQLIVDRTHAKGPLQGLLSTHLKYPDDDLLLLACDMIEMDTETLIELLEHALKFPGYDYYVYGQEDLTEPLCALYPSATLKKLYQELEQGHLPGFSLHKLIKKGNYKTLPINNIQTFNNYNTATI